MGREWEKKDVAVISWFLKSFLQRDSITLLLLNQVFLPWNSKHTGLRFGGKGKQTDFFPPFSLWALRWKGETQIWVGMGVSIFPSSLMYIPMVQYSPAKFSYTDWTVRFRMPACVIFGSPSTRRGLAREWAQSSNCGRCAIQRGRKWAFLPKQTSGHPQRDCQEITGWVGVMKTQ